MEYLFPPPPSRWTFTAPQQVWGRWSGREQEFYKQCSRLVETLSWQEVYTIGGADAQLVARLTREAYTKLLSDSIPKSLKVGRWKKVNVLSPDSYRIWSYNRYDPVDLPRFVMEALPYFDGRPTDEALQTIAVEKGVQIDTAYLRKLTDFGILEPV